MGLRVIAGMVIGLMTVLVVVGCATNSSGQIEERQQGDGNNPQDIEETTDNDAALSKEELKMLPEALKDIHERGILRVSMFKGERFPYFYENDQGKLSGSDVDIARDIAAHLDVKAQFVRKGDSFDEVVDIVAKGEADVAISKLSITLPRAQKVLFTDPYLELHKALLINRLLLAKKSLEDSDLLEQLEAMDFKIAVKAGTSYVGYAKSLFPKADIIQYNENQNIMDAAYNDKVLAAFYDEFAVEQYLKNHPGKSLRLKMETMDHNIDYLAFAVNNENPHLLSWLNSYLRLNQPFLNGIFKKYGLK
ncbi:MAG TPA: ABC transporter substrate-binding protein [Bacillales bacterium]|nr:ABC transporter substrate-binding protein [Bacillales bacterium]